MQIKRGVIFLLWLGLIAGCTSNSLKVNVEDVSLKLEIHRIDRLFLQLDTANFETDLTNARLQYPYFFGSGTTNFWKTQRTDPNQIKLGRDVERSFGNFEGPSQQLEQMLKHYFYYFPDEKDVQVVTYISNLDFDYPVIFADSLMFLALDMYLGESHPAYASQPQYLAQKRQPAFLVRDAAMAIAIKYFEALPPDAPFVHELVYQGALLYFVHALMPEISEEALFTYTIDQLQFCKNNERMIWNYFIDNQLLFDTSLDPKRRFVFPAPFSKFRTSFDNETPGAIGKWVGYQIVKAYMQENNLKINDLIENQNHAQIFKNSKYKP
jgi:hypothetical protein